MLQKQVKEGIDAVIVDSVLAIRKGLTGAQGQQEKESNGNLANGNGGSAELAIRANGGQHAKENGSNDAVIVEESM